MNTIKTFEEFINDKEYNLLLEEIDKGDFKRFENLSEPKQIKIMKTWNSQQWTKYRMWNTTYVSGEVVFDNILKIIRGEID